MPNYLKILKPAIQIVGFLFGMFGGFLTGIAPPEETGVKMVLGIASFLCLILLLIISALGKALPKGFWLGLAAAAGISFGVSALMYKQKLQVLTFVWSPSSTRYVTGDGQLTPLAAKARAETPSLTDYDLVAGFGGIDEARGIDKRSSVWPQTAILSSSSTLTFVYVWTVLSVSIAIFCAVEGSARPRTRAKPHKKKP